MLGILWALIMKAIIMDVLNLILSKIHSKNFLGIDGEVLDNINFSYSF